MTTEQRRPPGAGSISRSRDKWQVRITLADGRRPTLGTFKLDERQDAQDLLDAALQELAGTEAAPVGGITLTMFGRRVLDEREISGDVRDVDNERGRFELHIAKSFLGHMPLRAISARDVGEWYRELRGKPAAGPRGGKRISRKTVSEIVRILKMVFNIACEPQHGLIETSPAAWIRVKRELRTVEPWDYLREHEIPAVRSCEAIPEADRHIALFPVGVGLRLGEQMNLELPDLIVTGPNPEVIVRFGSKGEPPKNGRIRRVPLFGLGLELALRWLQILPTYAPKNPHNLVFPTKTGARRQRGKHLHGSRWDKNAKKQIKVDLFKEHLAAAGITRPFRWHDLRHTCGAALVSGYWGRAWPLLAVGEHLGHISKMSTERYAHLADSALKREARETNLRYRELAGSVSAQGCTAAANFGSEMVSVTEMPGFTVVGRQGLEPWTYGLKVLSDSQVGRDVSTPRSQHAADPVAVLRALVRRDAEAARAGGLALAERVLASPLFLAALKVLRRDEHIDMHIAELCELVLDAGDVAAAKRGAA